MMTCEQCGTQYSEVLVACPECAAVGEKPARPSTQEVGVARYVLLQPQRFSEQAVQWAKAIVQRRGEVH